MKFQDVKYKCHIIEMTEKAIEYDSWTLTGNHNQTDSVDQEWKPDDIGLRKGQKGSRGKPVACLIQ